MAVTVMEGVEPIIDAIITRFNDEVAAAVATVNARDTKGIELAAPPTSAILDYVPTPSLLTHFPTIAIEDGASRLTDDNGWAATGLDELVIVVFEQDADQRRLAIKLRRWQLIIRSIVLQDRTVGPAWGLVDKGTRPGPTLGRNEDPQDWMSWTALMVEVRSEQTQF